MTSSSAGTAIPAWLYDWHNEHLLRDQNLDRAAIARLLTGWPSIEPVLVLGAGTGRVANHLAETLNLSVVAVDVRWDRLVLISDSDQLGARPVCSDATALPLATGSAGAALMPYSFVHQFPPVLLEQLRSEAERVLRTGAILIIDISLRFLSREATPWRLVTAGHYELPASSRVRIEEFQRSQAHRSYIDIDYEFVLDGKDTICASERWWRHSEREVLKRFGDGFDLVRHETGYEGRQMHRRLLVLRASKEQPDANVGAPLQLG